MEVAADVGNKGERSGSHRQYITKLPSSGLLTHAVADAFHGFATVVSMESKVGSDNQILKEIAAASRTLPEEISWHVFKSPEEGGTWIVTQSAKSKSASSATTPEETSPGKASPNRSNSGILDLEKGDTIASLKNKLSPYLNGPSSVTRCRILLEPNEKPAVLDDTTVELETFKVHAGREGNVVDSAQIDFANCVPAGMANDVTIEVHQDLSDSRIMRVLYHYKDAQSSTNFQLSEGWARWRRILMASVDGQTRRQRMRGAFHTGRSAAGMTDSPKVGTVAIPDAPDITGAKAFTGTADGTAVISSDPLLQPFADVLKDRFQSYLDLKKELSRCAEGSNAGSIGAFADSYKEFGLRRSGQGWRYRDWLPGASKVFLKGDFNGWSIESHPCEKEDPTNFGENVWSIYLPDANGIPALPHKSKVKVQVLMADGTSVDRVPPWSELAYLSDSTGLFDGIVWNPSQTYQFKNQRPKKPETLKLYEAHIGMSSAFERIASFSDARSTLLPRIKRLGYNALLIVGLQEHSYYPSFGWHVTSFYASTSRCGDPDELMRLVDDAHGMGISVLASIVHSHAAPVAHDGLMNLDSNEDFGCYFRRGKKGTQPEWDAPVFDYENPSVLRFLLGNLKSFLERFHLDGFRFEGVASMLYHHHGINKDWSGDDYNMYFNYDVDTAATHYLMLANEVIKQALPSATTIANDKSASPTVCSPVASGGVGFDWKLATHHPAMWIQKLLASDEDEGLSKVVNGLEARRSADRTISCAERYDTLLKGKRPLKLALFAWESLLTHAVGGVAPHVTELAAGLARLGHEVHVYVRATGAQSTHSVHYGVHYHECRFQLSNDFVQEMINMCNSFVAEMRATEAFMKEKFAICHAHDWLAAKVLPQCAADGHICVQTMHSTEFGRCGNNAYGGESKRIADIEAEGCAVASRVICVSGVLAEEVTSLYGVHPEKIRVIYNGINANQFDGVEDAATVKAQYGVGAMDPLFLFVGRMAVQKGPDLLIEAIPTILRTRADSKFIIVGDGHMFDGLRKRCDQLGIGHACKMIGKLGGLPLKSLFKACDAVVVPSRNEPFGIVVLEAWSAHKPVVATTCGGPRDFVSHDIDGFLVDPTPGSISWGCNKILENFDHARWMGSRGRVKAAFNFSWDRIANQTRDCYYEQLARSDAAYCENPRGDSSLASRLMGSAVFHHMTIFDDDDACVRGLALHKMIRLLTCAIGGEGYMNTMGCEFGQPEFVDLPRGCNNSSFHHARTRWDLADDKNLKFKHFELFDACMVQMEECLKWMSHKQHHVSTCSEEDKVVAFERGSCLFVFNFHPVESYEGYQIGHSLGFKDLVVALTTDEGRFGGYDRISLNSVFPDLSQPLNDRDSSVKVYLPARTAMVLTSAAFLAANPKPKAMLLNADEYIETLTPAVPMYG